MALYIYLKFSNRFNLTLFKYSFLWTSIAGLHRSLEVAHVFLGITIIPPQFCSSVLLLREK
jgi:hypothetical protein